MDASDLLAVETLLFTNRIREAQETNPRAHRELINWGAWSRHLTGLKPRVARPSWCLDYRTEDWNEAEIDDAKAKEVEQRRAEETEVKAESRERELYRSRAADNLCVFMHQRFPWKQRRCLSVAYYWVFPEHQYAIRASKPQEEQIGVIDNLTFLSLFEGALKVIETEF